MAEITRTERYTETLAALQREHPNPDAKDIEIIRAQYANDMGSAGTPYSKIWLEFKPFLGEVYGWLAERVSGQTLIDLGGGAYGTGWQIAKDLDVGTYVSVDLHAFDEELSPNASVPVVDQKDEDQPDENPVRIHVKDDILNSLLQLRDGSAHFMLNGIDEVVRPWAYCMNDRDAEPRYQERIADELSRTVKPGGIIFGMASSALNILSRRVKSEQAAGLSEVRLPLLSDDFHIFQRKS